MRAKLSPKLVDWLRRAIEVRPEDRYKNGVSMYTEFKRLRNGALKKKRNGRHSKPAEDPALWQKVLFRQFQRKYRKVLETRDECRHCSGPVSEAMQACPWCGAGRPLERFETAYPATCPRCHRGSKLDWQYCPWCYGVGFEVETNRSYADRRYSHDCENPGCRGPLMPFMRYCPWCRGKVKRAWKLPGSRTRCRSCHWGVDTDFWHHCPWCTKALTK